MVLRLAGLIPHFREVEPLARSVPDTGGVYLVPAFAGLGAPYWDPHARGTIVGMSRGTTAAHLARATLDSIAYQTADVLEAMHADSGIAVTELRVDGGATQNDLLMQFQADVLGVPVVRPKISKRPRWGARYWPDWGGFWKNTDALEKQWHGPPLRAVVFAARRAAMKGGDQGCKAFARVGRGGEEDCKKLVDCNGDFLVLCAFARRQAGGAASGTCNSFANQKGGSGDHDFA